MRKDYAAGRNKACTIAAGLLLAGCSTSLTVYSDEETLRETYPISGGAKAGPAEGIVYFLPQGVFTFEIARRLKTCAGRLTDPKVEFDIKASSSLAFEADRAAPYVIDYERLERGLKEIDLTVKLYDSGTLESINATVTDKTAEALASVAQGAIRIAKMAAGVPTLEGGARESPCTKDAQDALAAYDGAADARKKKSAELDKLLLKDPKTDDDLKSIAALRKDIADRTEVMTRALAMIGKTDRYVWRPSGLKESGMESLLLPPDEAWLKTIIKEPVFTDEAGVVKLDKFVEANTSEARLSRLAADASGVLADVAKNPRNHLVYRAPAPAALHICEKSCGDEYPPPAADVLVQQEVFLPQAGARFALPLKNKMFDGQTLFAKFAPSGAPLEVHYVSKAEAAAAAKAFDDATKAAGSLVSGLKGEKLGDIEAQTELIKAQIALQKAKDELSGLSAPPSN